MEEKLALENRLKLIKALEDIRWHGIKEEEFNFETSFYAYEIKLRNDNSEEEKKLVEKILLTHWLIYICNRRMDYRHIFRAGGYIISKIVDDFYKAEDKKKFLESFCDNYVDPYENNSKLRLKVEYENNNDKIEYYTKQKLINTERTEFYFASNLITIDICSIYKTFEKLSCENNSFSQILLNAMNSDAPIIELAKKLYELTYQNIGRPSVGKIYNGQKFSINDLTSNNGKNQNFNQYKAKRIWCVIRDFLRRPIFSECFKIVIGEKIFDNLLTIENYKEIELPGDVWNNNKTFANCFWDGVKPYEDKYKCKKEINSSKMLADFRNKNVLRDFINPIDFDITFNFIPNMCSKENMCKICPIKNIDDFNGKLCHKSEGKLCTFALYSIGIEYKCNPTECKILKALTLKNKNVDKIV